MDGVCIVHVFDMFGRWKHNWGMRVLEWMSVFTCAWTYKNASVLMAQSVASAPFNPPAECHRDASQTLCGRIPLPKKIWKISVPISLRDYTGPLGPGLNTAMDPTSPCHCNLGILFATKKKAFPFYLTSSLTFPMRSFVSTVCVWEWAGMWRTSAWERGLCAGIAMDKLKHNIGLIFFF